MASYHFNVDFIKSEIEKRKMSKTRFAKECGISYGSLKKILSGNKKISPTPVLKVADYLCVKIDDLFFRT